MVTHYGFIHTDRLKSWSHLVQHNKQYHLRVLLNNFYDNGHPMTQKVELVQHTQNVMNNIQ